MPRPPVQRMPHYTIRLQPQLKLKVDEISIIYGAVSTSAFVRDLLAAVCSGDLETATAFQTRLADKMSGQLQLEIQAKMTELDAREVPVQPKRRALKRKGGRSAGRT